MCILEDSMVRNIKFQKQIKTIIEKDIDEAYFLLGLEYKKNPTYATMHNLGVLLSKYGHEISFIPQNYFAVAKDLLLSAKNKKSNFITLKELGDLFLKQKEYESAISYYTEALNQKITYSVCYNLALCYYFLNDYEKMIICLEQSLKSSLFQSIELAKLQELYGFACALNGDKQSAVNVLRLLQANKEYEYSPETLKLAYLCDEYLFIYENYKKIFNEWIIEAEDYKIIYQVFHKTYTDKIAEFESWINKSIFDFFIREIDTLKSKIITPHLIPESI